jgi:hypothetical protein
VHFGKSGVIARRILFTTLVPGHPLPLLESLEPLQKTDLFCIVLPFPESHRNEIIQGKLLEPSSRSEGIHDFCTLLYGRLARSLCDFGQVNYSSQAPVSLST